MTALSEPEGRPVVDWARHSTPWRAIALVAAVTLAYSYSLTTLVLGLALRTPLACLGFVPIIALLLGWVRLANHRPGPQIHDRQVDYIVGVGFIAAAFGIVVVLPAKFGTQFWLYRLDLLSLPLFVAGAVAIVYGVRRLWALRVPIVFLLFAWPPLYGPLLGDAMQRLADLTATGLALISQVLPLAHRSLTDPTVFSVGLGPSAFSVSIGSGSAGVNSIVGFILVGSALACVVRGSLLRRAAWLATGLTVVWLLNIARIEMVFAAGALGGRALGLGILHPVVGIAAFDLGVVAMLVAVPRFGLRPIDLSPARLTRIELPSPVRHAKPAFTMVAALAVVLAVTDVGFARFGAVATPLGQATRPRPSDIQIESTATLNVGGELAQVIDYAAVTDRSRPALVRAMRQSQLPSAASGSQG